MTHKLKETLITSIVIYVLIGWMFAETLTWSAESAIYPRGLFILMGILNTLMIVREVRASKADNSRRGEITWKTIRFPLAVFAAIALYVILFDFIGYIPASAIMITGFMLYTKVKPWWLIAACVVGYSLLMYFAFYKLLSVPIL